MTLTAVPGFDPQQSTLDAAQVFQNAPSPDALGAGDPLTMTATLDTPPGTGSPYQAVIDFDLLGAPSRPRGAVAVPGGYEACTAISKVKTADSITATCTANAPAGGSNGIVAVAVYPGSLLYHSSYAVAPVNDMGFTSKDVDPGVALVGVSCPTTSFCAAADGAGSVVFYRAGTGWQHPEPVDPHGAVSISCASADLCAIGDAHGGVAMYDGSGWSYDASADPGYALVAISCPDVDYCAAAGNGYSSSTGDYGDIVQWSGGAWTTAVNDSAAPPAPEGAEGMLGLSCAGSGSSVTCVAGDFSANAFYGGPNGWGQAVPLSSVPINSGYTYAGATGDVSTPIYPISCFAAGDYGCMAMEGAVSGLALGETNGGGLGWVPLAQPIDGDTGILADGAVAGSLSCADAVFCVNVDAYGRVQTWDGAGWAAPGSTALPQIDPSGALSDQYSTGVSCPSATFCVAVDGYDGNVWVGQG
ncbi:MAG TPA: hypothetical protein VMD59_23080 [Acidimicrobiales bacterium]|nr:hypothetical protein [Acidimicrobiales bacterium]